MVKEKLCHRKMLVELCHRKMLVGTQIKKRHRLRLSPFPRYQIRITSSPTSSELGCPSCFPSPPCTPPDPLLRNLHWLPVKQRIIFKLLLLVYKSLNNHAPKYLSDCLEIYVPGKRTRSSEDPLILTYLTKRKQTGDRTFTVASSIEWNKLPLTLRQSPSIETFKKSLKTHLF